MNNVWHPSVMTKMEKITHEHKTGTTNVSDPLHAEDSRNIVRHDRTDRS